MNRNTQRAFFIYELNRLHQECMVKARHLENVTSGDVAITFNLIDKCAETFIQLKQLCDIFMRIASDNRSFDDDLERIEAMKIRVRQYESAAYEHWNEIRNWDTRNKYPEFRRKKASVHKIGPVRLYSTYSRNKRECS